MVVCSDSLVISSRVYYVVQPPRPDENEMAFLTPEEIIIFLASAQKAPFPYYYLFRTILYTGLRRSEALGLTWRNLDFDLCALSVTHTQHRGNGEYIIQPPKTKNGRRTISLSPSLALLFRDYWSQAKASRLLLGRPLNDSDLVFGHLDGSPLDPPTVSHTFMKIVWKAGLKVRLRDLRHTYASIMLAAGVNVKAISQALGHSNVSITLNIYSHLLPDAGKLAAEKFDRLLKPWLNENVAKMLPNEGDLGTRLEGFEPTTLGSEDRCSVR
jgi:integrase